jgi:hypothetical protein
MENRRGPIATAYRLDIRPDAPTSPEGKMLRHVSRHPVRYALTVILLAFVVVTVVKTQRGEWFSFR